MGEATEPADNDGRRLPKLRSALESGINRSIAVQEPAVLRVAKLAGHQDPGVTPSDAVAALETYYRNSVVGLGAAAGATAAVPGVGTAVGVVANVGEIGAYLEATMLYCLALAHLHGIEIQDLDRRRLLLYAVLLGDGGARTVTKAADRVGKHWGKKLVGSISAESVKALNKVLGHNFITKWGTQQGILVLGREIPLGIGAGVGAAGNWFIARATIRASRAAFGPPPRHWPFDGMPLVETKTEA